MKPDSWTEISAADNDALMRVQTACSVEDLEALERIVEARINRALAAAPPPPVPAQAESEGPFDLKRCYGSECKEPGLRDRIRELEGEVARLIERVAKVIQEGKEWRDKYVRVADERDRLVLAADRLTLAAETARAALEPFAKAVEQADAKAAPFALSFDAYEVSWRFTFGDLRRAREALAALREGGKE